MPLGSVLKYMADHSPSATYAIELLCDVVEGLKYLHSENIVHGDLCGRNVLIDENGVARLTDFGLASLIESDTSIKSSTRSGSTRWMAPELLLPPPGSAFRRTPESDVWAFGCICCEVWQLIFMFQCHLIVESQDLVRGRGPISAYCHRYGINPRPL
ncbi:Kinase-like protein [Mycena venus]|uniref:Kinase-like protein n=1 Tax=Mycena venus TaxID=2733690 RepID=A0A8H6YRF5_9AGAR|nr:Kinase-like protein [Mycena venus]